MEQRKYAQAGRLVQGFALTVSFLYLQASSAARTDLELNLQEIWEIMECDCRLEEKGLSKRKGVLLWEQITETN